MGIPKVSVVIPVYNVEEYLNECLDSLIGQTLSEIEIICVDDGSTDRSLEVLNSYAEKDHRVKVLQQKNQYAGIARNNGLQVATGEYVIFLDSDDFFSPDLLEKTYKQGIKENADIVLFNARCFDTQSGEYVDKSHYFNKRVLGNKIVFSRKDFPEKLFTITTPCPWTKLFRKKFILEHNLQFQGLQNSNDAYFVLCALAFADRITYVDEKLVNYRIGQRNNLQSVKTKNPLLFFEAYEAVYDTLKERGLFEELEKTFVTTVISGCDYNLNTVQDEEAKEKIFCAIAAPHFTRMGILDHPLDFYSDKKKVKRLLDIKEMTTNQIPVYTKIAQAFNSNVVPKVSVIIPIYNVEKYLRECIDSVLKQSLREIEVICVNDGSPDDSLTIVEKYAKSDNRITIVSKKNGGLSSARNAGFAVARGKYVYYFDSDDIIVPDALEKLYVSSEQNQTDIIYFGAESFYETPELEESHASYKGYYDREILFEKSVSGSVMFEKLLEKNLFRSSVPLQFIRREFQEKSKILFKEGIIQEDELFSPILLAKAQSVICIKDKLYLRRVRDNSIMTSRATGKRFVAQFVVATTLMSMVIVDDSLCDVARQCLEKYAERMLAAAKRLHNKLPEVELQRVQIALPLEYHFFYKEMQMVPGSSCFGYGKKIRNTAVKNNSMVGKIILILQKLEGGIQCCKDHGVVYTIKYALHKLKKSK